MKLPEPVGALYTIAGAQHCTMTQALTDTNLYTEMQMIELRRATISEIVAMWEAPYTQHNQDPFITRLRALLLSI